MKLGEQAAWMSTDIHTKQCEVWGSCSSDREKLCILLLCHALQSDRYWPTFWRTPLPPLVEYKKIRDHVKIQGHDDRIQICKFLAPLCLPVRSQSCVRTPNRYYILRYQTGGQRMQLNDSIPTTEHFKINWPNGPTMWR